MYAGSQFVVGVYDKQHTTNADNWLVYDIISQFKKFVIAKYNIRLGKMAPEQAGAIRVIRKGDDGKYIREWAPLMREGTWRTTGKILKDLVALTPGLGDVLHSFRILNKPRSIEDLNNMSVHDKRNLVRTALDVIAVSIAYLLFTGIKGFRPEPPPDEWQAPERLSGEANSDYEKRVQRSIDNYYRSIGKNEVRQMRIVRAIQRGMTTALAVTPHQLLDMATSFALVSQARRLMNVIALNEPWTNLRLMIPGTSTIKSAKETYEFIKFE